MSTSHPPGQHRAPASARRRFHVLLAAVVAVCVAGLVGSVWHDGQVAHDRPAPVSGPATTPPAGGVAAVGTSPAGSTTSSSRTSPTSRATTSTPKPTTVPALALDPSCRRRDNPPTGARLPQHDPLGSDLAPYGAGAELQRIYRVSSTTARLTPADGLSGVRHCDQQLWAMVLAVSSPSTRATIDEFMVFDADQSRPGPGGGLVVGEVNPAETGSGAAGKHDPSHWRIALAPNGSTLDQVAEVVAHEVGHLISLNIDQVVDLDAKDCTGYFTGSGCAIPTSYLGRYLGTTWTHATGAAWSSAAKIESDSARRIALDRFYRAHAGDFVTRYAATDPIEDFAESFGYWCAFGRAGALGRVEGGKDHGKAKLTWMDDALSGMGPQHAARCQALRRLVG